MHIRRSKKKFFLSETFTDGRDGEWWRKRRRREFKGKKHKKVKGSLSPHHRWRCVRRTWNDHKRRKRHTMRKVVRFNSPPDFSSLHIQPVYHIQSAIYYYIWQNSEAIIIFHFPADNLDRVWRSSLDGRSWTHTCKEREREKKEKSLVGCLSRDGRRVFSFLIYFPLFIFSLESRLAERGGSGTYYYTLRCSQVKRSTVGCLQSFSCDQLAVIRRRLSLSFRLSPQNRI